MTSILDDVKEMLGLLPADTSFDNVVVMHINSAFTFLFNATGIGGPSGFEITGHQETWDMLFEDVRLNSIRSYVFVRVKVLFDPHIVGAVMAAHERQFQEMENRLQSEADY
jgi:hypothetical protein